MIKKKIDRWNGIWYGNILMQDVEQIENFIIPLDYKKARKKKRNKPES